MAQIYCLLREPEISVLPSRALCEGNTLFYGHVSFAEKVDLNENRKALGNVCWKSSNNNRSWNIIVAFFKSCLSISEENECLILALNLNHRTVFSILQCNRRGLRVIVAGLFLSWGLILPVSFPFGFFTWGVGGGGGGGSYVNIMAPSHWNLFLREIGFPRNKVPMYRKVSQYRNGFPHSSGDWLHLK